MREIAVPAPTLANVARQLRVMQEETDSLDEISNGAVDAIQAGRYEEAEALCERLLQEYPEITDPYDRMGMLREAQGRFQEAAEQYIRALEIVVRNPDDYDPVWVKTFERRRDEALARAKARA